MRLVSVPPFSEGDASLLADDSIQVKLKASQQLISTLQDQIAELELQVDSERRDKEHWMKEMDELLESSELMQDELKTLKEEDISRTEAIQRLEKDIANAKKESSFYKEQNKGLVFKIEDLDRQLIQKSDRNFSTDSLLLEDEEMIGGEGSVNEFL